jgi:hypothetical protein
LILDDGASHEDPKCPVPMTIGEIMGQHRATVSDISQKVQRASSIDTGIAHYSRQISTSHQRI